MAKVKIEEEGRAWREGELIDVFQLVRIKTHLTPLLAEWVNLPPANLTEGEQMLFEEKYQKALQNIEGWSEEDLKMKFITYILDLGYLLKDDKAISYFDKTISAQIDNYTLTVKSDFMIAKGILNVHKKPYFHFQEYKPHLNPKGEPMAQLIEAFLIGQAKNQDDMPMYGLEIVGKQWSFVVMQGKEYCISKAFDCTDREDLLKIIAILRKFKEILDTRLLVDYP